MAVYPAVQSVHPCYSAIVEGTGASILRPCGHAWQLLQRRLRRIRLRFHLLGPLHNDCKLPSYVGSVARSSTLLETVQPSDKYSWYDEVRGFRGLEHLALQSRRVDNTVDAQSNQGRRAISQSSIARSDGFLFSNLRRLSSGAESPYPKEKETAAQ